MLLGIDWGFGKFIWEIYLRYVEYRENINGFRF